MGEFKQKHLDPHSIYHDTSVSLNQPIVDISMDSNGSIAALCGKRRIYLMDLDNPFIPIIRTLKDPRDAGRDITSAKFNSRGALASTCSKYLTIWDLSVEKATPLKFQCHSRSISCIDWNPGSPGILASSSNDSNIAIWDLRSPEKPSQLRSWIPIINGSVKVQWNRKQSDHLLASSINSQLLIWDIRKTSIPMSLIMADTKPILDFDWSYDKSSQILTVTGSNVLKVWSLLHPKTPSMTITENKPIVKARFTPFGRGVVTVPMSKRHGWNLYALHDTKNPEFIRSFKSEDLDNYQWTQVSWRRSLVGGYYEHQFITWNGLSERLSLWSLDSNDYEACHYIHKNDGKPLKKEKRDPRVIQTTTKLSTLNPLSPKQRSATLKGVSSPLNHSSYSSSNVSSHPLPLNDEMALLSLDEYVDDLFFDPKQRTLTAFVKRAVDSFVVRTHLVFPNMYPYRAGPQITLSSDMDKEVLYKMKHELVEHTEAFVMENKNCVKEIVLFIHNYGVNQNVKNNSDMEKDKVKKALKRDGKNESGLKVETLPTSQPPETTKNLSLVDYVVQQGDTIASIALMNRMTLSEIKKWNNIQQTLHLYPGKVLKVKPSIRSSGVYGTFSKGSTLASSITMETLPDYYAIPCTYITLDRRIQGQLAMSSTLLIFEEEKRKRIDVEKPTEGTSQLNNAMKSNPMEVNRGKFKSSKSLDVVTIPPKSSDVVTIPSKSSDVVIIPPNNNHSNPLNENSDNSISISFEMNCIQSIVPLKTNKNDSDKASFYLNVDEEDEKRRYLFQSESSLVDEFCMKVISWIESKKASTLLEKLNIDSVHHSSSLKNSSPFINSPPPFLSDEPLGRPLKAPLKGDLKKSSSNVKILSSSRSSMGDDGTMHDTPSPYGDNSIPSGDDDSLELEEPRLLDPSALIDESFIQHISNYLPYSYTEASFSLIFSTRIHGTSLSTLYRLCKNYAPTLMVIGDKNDFIFGAFATEPWGLSTGYYGTGESFLYTYKPQWAVYNWTRANNYFQLATKKFISMGGGATGYGLWIDDDLNHGSSEVSHTYLNRKLAQTSEFTCKILEIWHLKE